VIDPPREARLAGLALRALALVLPLDAAGEPAQTIGEGIGRVRGGQGRDLLVGAIELGSHCGVDAPSGGGYCRDVIVGDRARSDGRGEQRHPAQQFRMADNLSSPLRGHRPDVGEEIDGVFTRPAIAELARPGSEGDVEPAGVTPDSCELAHRVAHALGVQRTDLQRGEQVSRLPELLAHLAFVHETKGREGV